MKRVRRSVNGEAVPTYTYSGTYPYYGAPVYYGSPYGVAPYAVAPVARQTSVAR